MTTVQETLHGEIIEPLCMWCGQPIDRTKRPRAIYCSRKCQVAKNHRDYDWGHPDYSREYREKHREIIRARMRAYNKTSREKALKAARLRLGNVCVICGCPYPEALTFGHSKGNGAEHRREIFGRRRPHGMQKWVVKATDEEISKWGVQLECCYCNFYHGKTGHYPPKNKRPTWPSVK